MRLSVRVTDVRSRDVDHGIEQQGLCAAISRLRGIAAELDSIADTLAEARVPHWPRWHRDALVPRSVDLRMGAADLRAFVTQCDEAERAAYAAQ